MGVQEAQLSLINLNKNALKHKKNLENVKKIREVIHRREIQQPRYSSALNGYFRDQDISTRF